MRTMTISGIVISFVFGLPLISSQWSLDLSSDSCYDKSHAVHYKLLNGWRDEGDICCERELDLGQDNGTTINRICCSTTLTRCEAITDPIISQIACCRGRWLGHGDTRRYDSNDNCNKDGKLFGHCRGPDSGKYELTGDLMPEPEDHFRLGALIENRCCVYRNKPLLYARYLKHTGPATPKTISLLSCCSSPTIAYRDRSETYDDCCAVHLFNRNTGGDNSFLCPVDGNRMPCCGSDGSSYCSSGSCVHKDGYATGCRNVSSIIREREKAGDYVHKFSDL